MNKKYFVLGGSTPLSKETLEGIRESGEQILLSGDLDLEERVKARLAEDDDLIHSEGRIVVKVDINSKDSHTFESGLTIRRERKFNDFNRRVTQPTNCWVISGEGIPKGAELLVEHNAFHETNRINDYKNSFESEESDRVRYFSLETRECYAWRVGDGDWTPIFPFEFALRVIKPYKGVLQSIEPEILKDTLFVTTGELKGKVVKTVKAADYQLVFQELSGREGNLICFRPNGDEKLKLEPEAIAILHKETEQVNSGELLVGYEIKDAKPLNELA